MIPINYFSVSLFLGSLIAFGSGIFAYFRNKKRLVNRAWLRLNIASTIWGFGYFLMIITSNKTVAWYSNWILHIAAILIPVLYMHFVLALIDKTKEYKRTLRMSYFLAFIFLVLNPSKLFIQDVIPKYIFNYVCDAGPLYIYFTAYFFGWALLSGYILYKNFKGKTGIVANQLKYVFFSSAIGFIGGGSVFLLTFNIPFPPYLIILYTFYPLVITYAIVKYRFMDVRAVVFRSFTFSLVLIFITVLYVILSSIVSLYFSKLFGKNDNIITGLVLGILIVLGYAPIHKILEQVTRSFLYRKNYNIDDLLSKINEATSSILDINQLLAEVSKTLIKAFNCEKFGIVLLNEEEENLKILLKEGFKPGVAESLIEYKNVVNILLEELERTKGILVIDEMKSRYENKEFQPISVDLLYRLNQNDIALVAPLYVKKRLIGVIAIGTKKSGELYDDRDINILNIIAGQIAVATENAQLYDQQKDSNATLQQKVNEQTKEIQHAYEVEKKAKEELQFLDKAKNQFLLTTQHHLRTPLTSMMGYVDLMLGGAYGKQSKKTRDVIQRFQVSTSSLIKMVNEFLDITQFQLGKEVVSLKPGTQVDLIIKEIVKELEFETKKKGIYLKFEKPKEEYLIKADPQKLKAALFNIFDNAVKYTQKGGVIIKMENHTENVKIIIQDTGIGISQEGLKNMFNKTFERGEQAKKEFVTGRGIGLYIASQIIKAHNGRIWAESEGEGKGSTFYIELPIELPAQ